MVKLSAAWGSTVLRLTSPLEHGPKVREAQTLLHTNRWDVDFHSGKVDGQYGPITAHAARRAKYYLGYSKKSSMYNLTFGAVLYDFLVPVDHPAHKRLPLIFRMRRANRIRRERRSHRALKRYNIAYSQIGYQGNGYAGICSKYGAWYGMECANWCFPAGTLIDTPRGMVPIETLLPTEGVFTATGKARPVEGIGVRMANTIEIRAQGTDGTITTLEHPFLARRRLNNTKDQPREVGEASWVPAGELRAGDYVAFPMPEEYDCIEDITPEQAYLIGRWVGDGYLVGQFENNIQPSVVITSSYGESEGLQNFISAAGYEANPQSAKTCIQHVMRKCRDFPRRLIGFGRGAHQKRIAGQVFFWPRTCREALLNGYVDADGYKDDRGRVTITTVSRSLALGTAKLVRSLGYSPSVSKIVRPRQATIQGRTVNQKDCYTVAWMVNPKFTRTFIEDGYMWAPITAIKDTGLMKVFNLQVADEHTFVADGMAVHNCAMFLSWCDSKAGGRMRYAFVPFIVDDAEAGRNHLSLTSQPTRGKTAVCWDWTGDGVWDHVEIFDEYVDSANIVTIGGNTGSINGVPGGEVLRQTRSLSLRHCFVNIDG